MLADAQLTPARQTIWAAGDLAAYSDHLRRAFPQVLFHEEYPGDLPEPPTVVFRDSLADIRQGMGQILIPAPEWRPDLVVKSGEYAPYWHWAEMPRISGGYRGSAKGSTFMPNRHHPSPHIGLADIYFRYYRRDLEAKAMVQKALRLIGKMSTSKLLVCDEKTLVVKRPAQSGLPWAGHHAIQWCLDDPRRTLDYWYLPVQAALRGPGPDVPGELALINEPIRARAADELSYTADLRRAFPNIRFIDGPLWWRDQPTLRFIDSIATATSAEVSLLFPSDGWQPQFARSGAGHWLIANRPFPHGTFTRSFEVTGRMWATAWRNHEYNGSLRFEWPAGLASAEIIADEAIRLSPPPTCPQRQTARDAREGNAKAGSALMPRAALR